MKTIFEIIYTIYKDGQVIGASNKFASDKATADKLAEHINKTVLDVPELPYKITFSIDSITPVKVYENVEEISA